MNRGQRRRSRGRSGQVGQSVRRYVSRQIHNTQSSIILRPPSDPRANVDSPWNHVVLTFTNLQKVLKVSDLQKLLITQLALPTASKLTFRILSIRIWTDLADRTELDVYIRTFQSSDNATDTRLVDYPGFNHRASVGYRYSHADQVVVWNSATAGAFSIYESINAGTIVKIDMLWKPDLTVPASLILLSDESGETFVGNKWLHLHDLQNEGLSTNGSSDVEDLSYSLQHLGV